MNLSRVEFLKPVPDERPGRAPHSTYTPNEDMWIEEFEDQILLKYKTVTICVPACHALYWKYEDTHNERPRQSPADPAGSGKKKSPKR